MLAEPKTLAALLVIGLLPGCATMGGRHAASHKEFLSPAERKTAIQRAEVWHQTPVAEMNLRVGPGGDGSFTQGQTVTCDYVKENFGGTSPKFGCAISKDDVVKVKYGRNNGEVYAGVAATRLLWALGFGADAMYPVQVVCRGCPASLADGDQVASNALRFDVAAIERKMAGHDMETKSGPGWAWPELDGVNAGAEEQQPQRDALKLLAVMLQHTDSKTEQQRLLCEDDKGHGHDLAKCKTPFMMVHDVGQTFGTANRFNRTSIGSVNLTGWAHTPVWKDAKRCVGNLSKSQTGTLVDPTISEAGRAFLADLLTALSDQQIRDLFDVAQFAKRPDADGHGTSVDDWVQAFRSKRQEIVDARCPS